MAEYRLEKGSNGGIYLRGRYELQEANAVLEDPFGLARAEVGLEAASTILVYPRLVELEHLFSDAGASLPEGRRLLMHKREILRLDQRIAEKGLTLVPLKLYFKNGIVKVLLGLGRGKNVRDKRDTIKEREGKREIERAMKGGKQ